MECEVRIAEFGGTGPWPPREGRLPEGVQPKR